MSQKKKEKKNKGTNQKQRSDMLKNGKTETDEKDKGAGKEPFRIGSRRIIIILIILTDLITAYLL